MESAVLSSASVFSFQFARWYITSASAQVFSEPVLLSLFTSLYLLKGSLVSLAQALVSLGCVLLLITAKLLTLVFPHFVVLARAVVDFHRNQLSTRELVIEFIAIIAVALFLWFRRRIYSAWHKFEDELAKKSRIAAKFAPHVLFFGISGIIAVVGQKFLAPLSSDKMLPVFVLILPMVTTCYLLKYVPTNESTIYPRLLKLWMIVAVYLSISVLMGLIPFSGVITRRLVFVREFIVLVSIWLQLSASSINIVYETVQPVVHALLARLPVPTISIPTEPTQRNLLMRTLVALGILTPGQETFLRTLLQDGLALIVSAALLFTPVPSVAVVAVALLVPAYSSSEVLTAAAKHRYDRSRATRWLQYWCCLAAVWLFRTYVMPGLWSSIQLAVCLWLQHSYFCGAAKVFAFAGDVREAVNIRHNRVPLTPNNIGVQVLDPRDGLANTNLVNAAAEVQYQGLVPADVGASTPADMLTERMFEDSLPGKYEQAVEDDGEGLRKETVQNAKDGAPDDGLDNEAKERSASQEGNSKSTYAKVTKRNMKATADRCDK
jgi:hypothetical protein